MANDIRANIDIGAKEAQRELRDTAKAAKDAGSEFEDTRSKAKVLADAITAMADKADAEMRDTEQIAERLAQALGPEMAAKIGQADIDFYASKLHTVGLTLDEVEADADELASALKRAFESKATSGDIDGVRSKVRAVGDDMDKVADRTDNTRSVMANFTGNAVSELPGIAGAMGPVNMAMGQFAEYAAEGNIKLRSFLVTGLGMGAAALALKGITGHMQGIAETKAWNTTHIERFVEKLGAAKSELDAIKEALSEERTFELRMDQGWDDLPDTVDVLSQLVALGLDVDKVSAMFEKGRPAIDAWRQSILDLHGPNYGLDLAYEALIERYKQYVMAQARATTEIKFFGPAADDAATAADNAAGSNDDLKLSTEGVADAFDTATGKADAMRTAIDKLTGAGRTMEQASQDWEAGVDALSDSFDENGATLDASTEKGRANRDAVKAQVDTLLRDYIPALVRSGLSNEEASAHALTLRHSLIEQMVQHGLSREAAEEYIDTLGLTPETVPTAIELAGDADAKTRVQALIDQLNNTNGDGIPATTQAEIQALIDEGEYAEAERRLAQLARDRRIKLLFGPGASSGSNLDDHPYVKAPEGQGKASGGPTTKGTRYPFGEHGSEVVYEDGRAYLLPGANGEVVPRNRIGTAAPSVQNNTIINNFPPGISAQEVARQARLDRRRNGET